MVVKSFKYQYFIKPHISNHVISTFNSIENTNQICSLIFLENSAHTVCVLKQQGFGLMLTLWQHPGQIKLCFLLSNADNPQKKKIIILTIVTLFWLWEIKLEDHTEELGSYWRAWHLHIHTLKDTDSTVSW